MNIYQEIQQWMIGKELDATLICSSRYRDRAVFTVEIVFDDGSTLQHSDTLQERTVANVGDYRVNHKMEMWRRALNVPPEVTDREFLDAPEFYSDRGLLNYYMKVRIDLGKNSGMPYLRIISSRPEPVLGVNAAAKLSWEAKKYRGMLRQFQSKEEPRMQPPSRPWKKGVPKRAVSRSAPRNVRETQEVAKIDTVRDYI